MKSIDKSKFQYLQKSILCFRYFKNLYQNICLRFFISLLQISAIKTAVLFCQFFEISWKWSCQWLFECENSWKNAVISFEILCPARKFREFALTKHNWKTFWTFANLSKKLHFLSCWKICQIKGRTDFWPQNVQKSWIVRRHLEAQKSSFSGTSKVSERKIILFMQLSDRLCNKRRTRNGILIFNNAYLKKNCVANW